MGFLTSRCHFPRTISHFVSYEVNFQFDSKFPPVYLLDRVPCAKLTAFSQARENRQMFHGLGSVGHKKNQIVNSV